MIIKVIKEVDIEIKVGSLLKYVGNGGLFLTKNTIYPVIAIAKTHVEILDDSRSKSSIHELSKDYLQENFEVFQQ